MAVATPIKSVNDVNLQVEKSNKVVLLDFYADWCISCKLMERTTLENPEVTELLKKFTLLKANVTHNNKIDKALQHHYGVIAPPTFVFLAPNGQELTKHRIVGEMNAKEFAKHLQDVLKSARGKS